jgi:hypothetical protein
MLKLQSQPEGQVRRPLRESFGDPRGFCISFAGQLEGCHTCMYVRLLGPCFRLFFFFVLPRPFRERPDYILSNPHAAPGIGEDENHPPPFSL